MQNKISRRDFLRGTAAGAAMLLVQSVPVVSLASESEGGDMTTTEFSAFESAFLEPSMEAKPIMRWWIAPGRMTEEEVYKEMANFAEGGYGGVEVQSLEMAKDCVINDETWNASMKWILKAGLEYGLQVDCTVGQMWPVATPEITDVDDTRCEQQLWEGSVVFSASEDNETYTSEAWVLPTVAIGYYEFDTERAYQMIAVTAAMATDEGSYDPDTAVALEFDSETGAVSWSAPSQGDWTIFYYTSQTANHTLGYGMDQFVIDHMSPEGTQAVIDNWEAAMNSDDELRELYEENAGSIFGDSFELRSNLWTPAMLEEFETRRGYALTPYLPVIYNELGATGERVRSDLYTTMTELLSENHMRALKDWANSHNMTLRYQAYSSAGSSVFELTDPSLNVDIAEAESYAMSGSSPDSYRQLSGAVHMNGNVLYTAEAAEVGNDDWREAWTAVTTMDGNVPYEGFMYYAYRLFAGGVNKLIFHGSTYKFTDTENMYFDTVQSWPGYSAMAALFYGNEWDDKTPMWENADITTKALSRMQMVLQQGIAKIDLAVYRYQYGKGNIYSDITDLEKAGYTYDYVTPTVLGMDPATVSSVDGQVVLAADGPSYRAMIIEPMSDGTVPSMPLETAQKILELAQAGFPVVIIGDAPVTAVSAPGSAVNDETLTADENAALAEIMEELQTIANVMTAESRADAVSVLAALGVTPDAQPENEDASALYFQHRAMEEADLYFIYNDSAENDTQKVTLKGNGKPYILDAWSGDVTPIAEYTDNGGSLTISIQLSGEDAAMIAIANDGWSSKIIENCVTETTADGVVYDETAEAKVSLRAAEAGEYSVTFADGTEKTVTVEAAEEAILLTDWKMVLNQWTEEPDTEDPFDTRVVPTDEYDLSETGLVPWYEIDSENLTKAAGVASYTTSFELEKGWEEGQGAYLEFTDISDIGRLFVNGQEAAMNQLSLRADIGKYLTAGTNTIEVLVSSNLSNIKYAADGESWWYGPYTAESCTYAFGIIGDVTLTPYSYTAINLD